MINHPSKHILIVDDSKDQQFLLKMLLEDQGYTTDCSSNREEALELLRSPGKIPQTILLDLQMPIMDGYDFRSAQRADPDLCKIPVIVLSGEWNTVETQRRTHSEVLLKPFTVKSLMSAIEKSVVPN